MDRRSTQSTNNQQQPYRSSMTVQLQQPNADPQSADDMLQNMQSPFAESRPSYRQSSSATAYPRASVPGAANQHGFNTAPLAPRTPPASLTSTAHPAASLPVNSTAAMQRASATAAAVAARSRQSSLLNNTAAGQPPLQRTSMLVQLQQPTAQGGSTVQPVRHSLTLTRSIHYLHRHWKPPLEQSTARRHLSFNADCFSEAPENLTLFTIISFPTLFGFQFCIPCIAVV